MKSRSRPAGAASSDEQRGEPTTPTRRITPAKALSELNRRAHNFAGESVEVDAIGPAQLLDLARQCIQMHVRLDTLERMQAIEAEERKSLEAIIANLAEGRS